MENIFLSVCLYASYGRGAEIVRILEGRGVEYNHYREQSRSGFGPLDHCHVPMPPNGEEDVTRDLNHSG